MELGIHVIKFDHSAGPAGLASELARAGDAAERAGATWLSLMDHYFQMEHVGRSEDAMLEGYTTLGYLAAHTERVELGLLVTGVTYRHPGLLAKIATTLDVLSGGRAVLGLGAAWYEREHRALGVPFPPVSERFERLEETVRICLQMWDPDNDGPFHGTHYQLAETICAPRPLGRPRPPILIGGGGERKTLRLVARHADACNLFGTSPADVAHKLEVLRAHCADTGRDDAEIRKTILYPGGPLADGDTDAFVAEMIAYADLGIEQVMVVPPDAHAAEWIEKVCAPAVPRLAELSGRAV